MDIPLVVTEQYPKGLGHTVDGIKLSENPRASIFEKTSFSMLSEQVRAHIVKETTYADFSQLHFVLFGIEAHVCVLQTAIDLRQRYNAQVHLAADGTSSRHTFERKLAFQHMRSAGVHISSAESIAFQLLERSDSPYFKEAQKLFIGDRPDTGLDRLIEH
eukprot:CAMPEP_0201552630 /NCGR_PEP_ID=MMETSP0173_2-20130828/16824_1 /ASSEMBLY_ACC=CAM_ASM_000268 /TAXON_ID=218659 /ORGANISM="Vexillifera sp., Strain DIVA3 564/2" /LENGTH=159 /DNA_ID=CAMNT_0047963137 /DNA_START=146 /DNA_END=625 /DNA_ORIENTATION=+